MKPHLPRLVWGTKKNPRKPARRIGFDLQRIGLAIATIVILSVVLSIHLLPSKVSLKPGDISPTDIVARRAARYIDTLDTQRRIAQAAASVGKVYDPLPAASDQAVGALKNIFHALERVRASHSDLSAEDKAKRVREQIGAYLGAGLSDGALETLASLDSQQLGEIRDSSIQIVSAAMGTPIRDDPESMREARAYVADEAKRLVGSRSLAGIVSELAGSVLRANRVYNAERTLAEQDKAQSRVRPEWRIIEPGQLVIARGEQVMQEHIDRLEALGLTNPKLDYSSIAARVLLVVLAVLLVLAYLARYYGDVYANTRTLLLLALIVVVSVFALRLGGSVLGISLDPIQIAYLMVMWVTATGMLLAVLLNPQISVVIAALLSIVVSLLLGNELRYAASALISALVGIYSVADIRDRKDLMRATGLLAAAGVVLVWTVGGMSGDSMRTMLQGSVWAVGVAVGATWLFWIGTALLERPFIRTTHISLLELADTNKPLLRRLMMEAPGTYTHSVTVGQLAEAAADATGADSLVARVASYYHDIGKMRRPHFFIENQHMDNVHDRMNPTLSALVITSHIKDGVEIAREFRLPKLVTDIITEHHGTSLVQYFYSQIAGEQEPSTALEQQFRYHGPKPRTREAAIVMLADSVEAASRCITKPTPAKIELMVNRIVADKLRDGQLDESDLTFREVGRISDAFVRVLIGTLHARIDYPESPNVEARRPSVNGSSGSKLADRPGAGARDQEQGRRAAAS